jgi:hypothetical protein
MMRAFTVPLLGRYWISKVRRAYLYPWHAVTIPDNSRLGAFLTSGQRCGAILSKDFYSRWQILMYHIDGNPGDAGVV